MIRQPGIEPHLHYNYERGKGMVQPASCMPGLEEWIHYGQYQELLKKKKKEVFDPKERPSDSRCIPRKRS
ncbi:unnamed protein product [Ilex paraguariensis]|uniref:Uncharacterized protein n=1 Tax=Ilex paraguariensis TaxID=185542 RepID=A0ABC8S647_9AQUA